jgi:hypothetical protein
LRRATTIENGQFKIQAQHLLQFQQQQQDRPKIIHNIYQDALTAKSDIAQVEDTDRRLNLSPLLASESGDQSDDLTRSMHPTNLPTYPLDRLSRYETALWRQAGQILLTLRCLNRRKPWERLRLR